MMMDTIEILNREFFSQNFSDSRSDSPTVDFYRLVARNYARMENAIAVLSDLHDDSSYIYYGGFADTLGLDRRRMKERIASIWEEDIFRLIHPDDLTDKHLNELRFLHFIRRQPKVVRKDYCLFEELRMKSSCGTYLHALHRMFYISAPSSGSLLMALCLYSAMPFDVPSRCAFVNTADGTTVGLESQNNSDILSRREKQTLSLIDRGLLSKEIAQMLSISVHTVSRHRQSILNKLQVNNSIEACRIAKRLKLI